MLHIRIQNIGLWLVGLAGMAMMVLCVSGVIIHRKIFTDFFTFRPERKPRRLILDLHNVTGVLGLPFHFLISLSGLIIFWATYFPSSWQVTYNDDRLAFFADAYGNVIPKGRSGEARRHGLVRRHGRRGAAPVGRLGAALLLRPQSRRCQVGRADRPPRRGDRQQHLRRGLFRRADRRADQLSHRHGAGHEHAALHLGLSLHPVPPLEPALDLFRPGPRRLRADRDRLSVLARNRGARSTRSSA